MYVDVIPSRDVQTTLNFYAPLDTQLPYTYVDPPLGVPKTNVGQETHTVIVHDARGKCDLFSLDVTGFQFAHWPSIEKDFVDEDRIKTVYYAECEQILKKYAGAKRAFIFDHSIRRSIADHKGPRSLPYHRVHVDQTPIATMNRVKHHFGDEAERLLQGRYGIINVWRPIVDAVAHTPLALVDYRSVDPDNDLVSTRHVRSDREGSLFFVKYNPRHEWYYLSDQTPDEVTLIKCFDSDVDKARLTPHSAFHDNTSPADVPQRQSIEVRALVFDTE